MRCVAIRSSKKLSPRPRRKTVKLNHAVLLRGVTLVDNMKDWEIIVDNLSKAGWSWGCVSAIDSNGRTIWIAEFDVANGTASVALCGPSQPPLCGFLNALY